MEKRSPAGKNENVRDFRAAKEDFFSHWHFHFRCSGARQCFSIQIRMSCETIDWLSWRFIWSGGELIESEKFGFSTTFRVNLETHRRAKAENMTKNIFHRFSSPFLLFFFKNRRASALVSPGLTGNLLFCALRESGLGRRATRIALDFLGQQTRGGKNIIKRVCDLENTQSSPRDLLYLLTEREKREKKHEKKNFPRDTRSSAFVLLFSFTFKAKNRRKKSFSRLGENSHLAVSLVSPMRLCSDQPQSLRRQHREESETESNRLTK